MSQAVEQANDNDVLNETVVPDAHDVYPITKSNLVNPVGLTQTVAVGVCVGDADGVFVGVGVRVVVGDADGVTVPVGVGVCVGDADGVTVPVGVGVCVGNGVEDAGKVWLGVCVGVWDGVGV